MSVIIEGNVKVFNKTLGKSGILFLIRICSDFQSIGKYSKTLGSICTRSGYAHYNTQVTSNSVFFGGHLGTNFEICPRHAKKREVTNLMDMAAVCEAQAKNIATKRKKSRKFKLQWKIKRSYCIIKYYISCNEKMCILFVLLKAAVKRQDVSL